MRGISNSSKEAINKVIESLFDRIGQSLLGNIPAFKNKKTILFSSNPTMTLAHLFLQGMGNTRPLPKEEEVMKKLLSTAHDYLESLKGRTKARVTEAVDSYVAETRAKGETPSEFEIKKKILDGLGKAGKELKTIGEAEATKARNMGKLMTIGRVGASLGISDPTVFWIVLKDNSLCVECKRLHLLKDGITPRVWKMSELGYSYHKKGENNPKIMGLHPRCRCTCSLLSPGYGYKNGLVSFISLDHDEFKKQRGEE